MKNKLLMGAAALGLLGALGHFGAKPLMAQVRAALVKNIDERGRSPYMVQVQCSGAVTASSCIVPFPAVPVNRRFVVEYINGFVRIDSLAQYIAAEMSVPQTPDRIYMLATHLESSASGFDLYSISMPAVMYFEAGQITNFAVFGSKSTASPMITSLELSGYLIDLTQ